MRKLICWFSIVLIMVTGAAQSAPGDEPILLAQATTPTPLLPRAPTLTLDFKRVIGDAKANVIMVEFTDFQCPYCRDFHVKTWPQLKRDYIDKGRLRYFHKDFPLAMHANAIPASVVGHCAAAQGRFWEMHHALYDKQANLGEPLYQELAKSFKFDLARFDACRKDDGIRRLVAFDYTEGRSLGIASTPTFVIGRIVDGQVILDRVIEGAVGFDAIAQAIEITRSRR